MSGINGMITDDFDGDGDLDILMSGNDYGTDVSTGRYDAGNGVFLKGDGKGNFTSLSILQSGWFIPGNGKAIAELRNKDGHVLIVASQNRGRLKMYTLKRPVKTLLLNRDDVSLLIKYKNGKTQKREVNYGSSFLSQSARFTIVDSGVVAIEVTNGSGVKRIINSQ